MERTIIDEKTIKLSINRGGNGGLTCRATIPADWVKQINVNKENPHLKLMFDGETIYITKGNDGATK